MTSASYLMDKYWTKMETGTKTKKLAMFLFMSLHRVNPVHICTFKCIFILVYFLSDRTVGKTSASPSEAITDMNFILALTSPTWRLETVSSNNHTRKQNKTKTFSTNE